MFIVMFIILFVAIGIVLGLIIQDEKRAICFIIIISVLWGFIFGPWAIATFIELIFGYYIVQKKRKSKLDKKKDEFQKQLEAFKKELEEDICSMQSDKE